MISSFLVSFSDPSLETELAIEIEHLRFEWHSWSLNRSSYSLNLITVLSFGIAVQGNRKKERKENGLRVSFFRVSRRRVVFEAQKHRKEIRSTRAKEDDARTLIVLVEVWIRKKKNFFDEERNVRDSRKSIEEETWSNSRTSTSRERFVPGNFKNRV